MRPFLALLSLLAGTLSTGLAADPSLGVALARGDFRVDGAAVRGTATLMDGASIATAAVSTELRLSSGVRMILGADSLGRVHRDRFVLEKGRGRIDRIAPGYRIEALGLHVFPSSSAQVSFTGAALVQVAALRDSVRVADSGGLTLASIPSGLALDFQPQPAGAAPASVLTGVLRKKDAHFLLPDETTRVTFDLLGGELEDKVGKCVEATGTIDPASKAAAGASQVLRVIGIKVTEGRCKPLAAGPAGKAAAAGLTGKQKAIIAGVVIGASATGAAVIATRGAGKAPVSP